MDGIDAALVDLPANRLVHGITKNYTDETKSKITDLIMGKNMTLADVCHVNTLVGREFASAVIDLLDVTNTNPNEVEAIGSHGQTVCHDPLSSIPYTLQLGCGHTISSMTGITVVADFRTRDLVNGGQGAPFAPLYHQELFAADEPIAIVNIGGIANATFITPKHATEGWDTGPGNCLMDAWIHLNSGKSYDDGGAWASQGTVIKSLLEQLLSDPFFSLSTPKSIGKEYFSIDWLNGHLQQEYKAVDIQSTLLALTAHSIATTILSRPLAVRHLYLCGGGTHNRQLQTVLASLLPGVEVASCADVGVNPDFLEAMMFAWLAAQTMQNQPVDLKAITGTKSLALLGAIYPIIK